MRFILLLPILALCCWLYAERRLGFAARFCAGIVCIASTGFACHAVAKILPRIESTHHRSSLRLAEKLSAQGETQRVLQAIQTYNNIAVTGTTYRASMQMWQVLNHGPKE